MPVNNQSRDIAKAITALEALKAKTQPEELLTIARQIDSYEQHKEIAKEAGQVAIDFLTDICASAASLGNDENSAEIRETFRIMIGEALEEVFVTADIWADEARDEFGLEAA